MVVNCPIVINLVNGLARVLVVPSGMFIYLIICLLFKMGMAANSLAGNMRLGAPPVAVEGPKLVFRRVARPPTERLQIGVAGCLLCAERRIEVSLTKVLTGTLGAIRGEEHCVGIRGPIGVNVRHPSGPMKPFARQIARKGLIGQNTIRLTGSVGFSLGL
jgi:hypothetical protein